MQDLDVGYQGDGYQGDGYQGDGYQGDEYQGDGYQGDGYQGDGNQGDGCLMDVQGGVKNESRKTGALVLEDLRKQCQE